MKYLSFLITAFALALGACESHSWEDQKDADGKVTEKGTKRLFENHDAQGEGHDAAASAPDGEDANKNGSEAHGGGEAEH